MCESGCGRACGWCSTGLVLPSIIHLSTTTDTPLYILATHCSPRPALHKLHQEPVRSVTDKERKSRRRCALAAGKLLRQRVAGGVRAAMDAEQAQLLRRRCWRLGPGLGGSGPARGKQGDPRVRRVLPRIAERHASGGGASGDRCTTLGDVGHKERKLPPRGELPQQVLEPGDLRAGDRVRGPVVLCHERGKGRVEHDELEAAVPAGGVRGAAELVGERLERADQAEQVLRRGADLEPLLQPLPDRVFDLGGRDGARRHEGRAKHLAETLGGEAERRVNVQDVEVARRQLVRADREAHLRLAAARVPHDLADLARLQPAAQLIVEERHPSREQGASLARAADRVGGACRRLGKERGPDADPVAPALLVKLWGTE